MITDKEIELIEKNILGKQTEEEKKYFEQRIMDDNEFAQEVSFIQDLQVISKELAKEELKNKLKRISAEYNKANHENKFGFKTYFAIAASILIVIGVATFLYLNQSGNNKNIVASNSEINLLIKKSANQTKYVLVTSIGNGYGYAGVDSSVKKLPVVIINSEKYANQYLYRDTLFLFSPEITDIHFYFLENYSERIYLAGNEKYFFIELKSANKILPIQKEGNIEVIEKLNYRK